MGNNKKFKRIKRFHNFNKHLVHFIALAVVLFIIAGLAHLFLLLNGIQIAVVGILIPIYISYFVIAVSFFMTIMGIYYMKAFAAHRR